MSVAHYQPWTRPWSLQRDLWQEVNRAFDRLAGEDASSSAVADWIPPVDIEEGGDRFVLYADVPGVDPESIEVTLESGVLTLSGAREARVEKEGDKPDRRRIERAHGKFFRRFTLPDTADADKVSARGHNGVLEVVIPKRAASQPRRISVAA